LQLTTTFSALCQVWEVLLTAIKELKILNCAMLCIAREIKRKFRYLQINVKYYISTFKLK
jgi:hypothetical protein